MKLNFTKDEVYSQSCFKLGIISLNEGDGCSMVCEYVLKNGLFIGQTPRGLRSLVELGSPHFYQSLSMDKRFSGREFFDFTKGYVKGLNMELGYNWYIKRNDDELKLSESFRIIASVPGTFAVFDLSGLQKKDYLFDLLSVMDLIYLVIDPLPEKLLKNEKLLNNLKTNFENIEIVINKYTKGINKREIKEFLGSANYHIVEAVSTELVQRAAYSSQMVF